MTNLTLTPCTLIHLNCKSFETNSNLLDKNGKPVEIMVCDVQELHFFVPKN